MAQLSAVKGSVMVSQGGKMVNASGVSSLRAGDRVVAKDGAAQVSYADGCIVSLQANGMATIGAASPCASGAGLVSASQGSSAQMFGGLDAGWIVGGAWALGVIILVANDDNDDNGGGVSVSP
jgi:hypothetical protein